jgi:hypothetical protein
MTKLIYNKNIENFEEILDTPDNYFTINSVGTITDFNSGLEELTTIKIPSTKKGIDIKRITYKFENYPSLKHIIIPASVTNIIDSVFSSCNNLTEVTFEGISKLDSINNLTFSESGLKNIKIPKSVKSIGSNAFINCYNLKDVTFEESSNLEIIRDSAFNSSGLETITIPKNVTSIDESAFWNCKKN